VTSGPARLIPCVGAIVHDDSGRLLLVQRANPPSAGCWTIPGGRVEPGETDQAAVAREVAEETGLVVEPLQLVGTVQRDAAAGWFAADELAGLPMVPGLLEALGQWGVLPG
jgi:8-oxo-dGTP diphosphatase